MESPIALITGAAKRLGANTATHLHSLGYVVIIHFHHSINDAQILADKLNNHRANSAHLHQSNLSEHDNLTKLANDIKLEFGRLDVLINNVSSFYPTPITSLSVSQYNDLITTNMTAPLFLTQACEPLLRKSNGVVINMCDIHASRPLVNHSAYCMAKAGLKMMTLALANEPAPSIRVNGVAPGAIEWPSAGIDGETVNEVLKSLERKGHVNDMRLNI